LKVLEYASRYSGEAAVCKQVWHRWVAQEFDQLEVVSGDDEIGENEVLIELSDCEEGLKDAD